MTKIIFMLIVFALLITGCSSNNDTNEVEEIEIIVSSVGFNPIFYPLENNKITKPDNIDISLKVGGLNEVELYTLTSKKNGIGILSSINIARAYENGREYKVLAPYYRETVGPDNRSMGQIITNIDSDIETIGDLYGKTVGIQGEADGSTIALKTALRLQGVNIGDINFKVIDTDLSQEILSKGDVDATMVDSDVILSPRFDSRYKTVYDFGLVIQENTGTVPPVKFFVVEKNKYEENPKIYDKTIEFLRENYQWSRNNQLEISNARNQKTNEDINLLISKFNYENRLDTLTDNDIESLNEFYITAKNENIINGEVPISNLIR